MFWKNGTQFNKDKYKVIYFIKDYELHKYIMRNNSPGSSLGEEDLARTVSHKPKPPYYCWKAMSLGCIKYSGKHHMEMNLSVLVSIDKTVFLMVQERQRKRKELSWNWGMTNEEWFLKPEFLSLEETREKCNSV